MFEGDCFLFRRYKNMPQEGAVRFTCSERDMVTLVGPCVQCGQKSTKCCRGAYNCPGKGTVAHLPGCTTDKELSKKQYMRAATNQHLAYEHATYEYLPGLISAEYYEWTMRYGLYYCAKADCFRWTGDLYGDQNKTTPSATTKGFMAGGSMKACNWPAGCVVCEGQNRELADENHELKRKLAEAGIDVE